MDKKVHITAVSQRIIHCSSMTGRYILQYFAIAGMFYLIEALTFVLMGSSDTMILAFGALWSCLLAAVVLLFPRKVSRILFGTLYYGMLLWSLAQCIYFQFFGNLMWLSSVGYAGESTDYLADIIAALSPTWCLGAISLMIAGVYVLRLYPKISKGLRSRLPLVCVMVLLILGLHALPSKLFQRDEQNTGTVSENTQTSCYEATYKNMYNAYNLYSFTGIYHTTCKDIWHHILYPLTPAYQAELKTQAQQINDYFSQRGDHATNNMTGLFAGKNVILVLMESMDDYMITPEETPAIYQLMDSGIQFTQFYTPGFGTARTINSEFCMNTGIYLPTTGKHVFHYVNNSYQQSLASQLNANGYTSQMFHFNSPEFYSRGQFSPALGYTKYNSYADYTADKNALYDDCLLFDIPELKELFFREGSSFNTVITHSAHLSYKYNDPLSHYALNQYPEYKGKYGSEEEDCARVKAKLVDDFFARLLQDLEASGQLENTVIIGMTDHYTYGYKNTQELLQLSGVSQDQAILLEKTPCFIWSPDCPDMEVTKTMNTADLLPTVLNLLGIDSPYHYLGQDVFDPNYAGYAIFSNGSWIQDGVICQVKGGTSQIIGNLSRKELTAEYLEQMAQTAQDFIHISNLLLTSDYYRQNR